MRKIDKKPEPSQLRAWKRRNPQGTYRGLSHVERQAIRHACVGEQFHLCAYCCQAITGDSADTSIEHLEAQRLAPHRSLDYGNMVGSCNTENQCNRAHGAQPLPLTPLMAACETELLFRLTGLVEGLTERARETIKVLNLGDTEASNQDLVERRRYLTRFLLFSHGLDPRVELGEDEETLRHTLDRLNTPRDGKLEAFAPVAANIIRRLLSGA